MRFETAKGTCGPVALYNVLLALGDRPSLKKIRQDCGTNPEEGTQPNGLKQGIERAGREYADLSAGFDEAYEALHAHLLADGGAIVLTEAGDHWEAAIGVLGPRIILFNSDRLQNPENRAANGVNVLTRQRLRTHWDAFEGKRYALLVK